MGYFKKIYSIWVNCQPPKISDLKYLINLPHSNLSTKFQCKLSSNHFLKITWCFFYWLSHIKLFSKLQNNQLTLYWTINNLFIKYHIKYWEFFSEQFSSITQLCPTLCDPKDCSTPGFPVHHQLPELAQIHVHWVSDAIQPSHPLPSSSPLSFNLSEHQSLFQWVSCSHQVAKVLEFKLQHESFQKIFRTDFI